MFTINHVTEEQIETIIKELPSTGTIITQVVPNNYRVVGHGVTANAIYDANALTLTVVVAHKPFYIPEYAIQSGLEKALKG